MTASEVTIDGTLTGDPVSDTNTEDNASLSSSFEKIKAGAMEISEKAKVSAMRIGEKAKIGAMEIGAKAKVSAMEIGEKAKVGAMEIGEKASTTAKQAVDNESFIQTGLAVSLGATVITSVRSLNMRQYHPYAGAALVGFTLLHLLQNKRKRTRRTAHNSQAQQD